MEALYALSVDLLKATEGAGAIGQVVACWMRAIGAASGGLFLYGASPQQQQILSWTGEPVTEEVEDLVAGVGRHKRFLEVPSRFGRDLCAPLSIAGKPAGALFVRGSPVTRGALESVAALVARTLAILNGGSAAVSRPCLDETLRS